MISNLISKLQEKTDICFTYTALERTKLNSRAVVKNIRFTIRPNNHPAHPMYEGIPVSKLLGIYCNERTVASICKRYDEEHIRINFDYVEQCESNGTNIANKPAFLSHCLKYNMALNHNALKPTNYDDLKQKEFLKKVVMNHWQDLSSADKEEFRTYGFNRGILSDIYKLWMANIDDATIDDQIWDLLITRNQV